MQRRKFIAGVGSLAAASAAAMGTGAFTSVKADRAISVTTANDANAFLGIEAMDTENGEEYVEDTDGNGTVALDFTEANASENGGGSGVNKDSFTVFDDLLKITNQGTQPVIVGYQQDFQPQLGALYHEDQEVTQVGESSQYDYSSPNNSGIINVDTADVKNLPVLSPGESLTNIGFFVTPKGSATENYIDGNITFLAGAEPSDIGL
ncbi:MAG: hypothetical protein ABEJ88_09325 [Halobacterium sp.]